MTFENICFGQEGSGVRIRVLTIACYKHMCFKACVILQHPQQKMNGINVIEIFFSLNAKQC